MSAASEQLDQVLSWLHGETVEQGFVWTNDEVFEDPHTRRVLLAEGLERLKDVGAAPPTWSPVETSHTRRKASHTLEEPAGASDLVVFQTSLWVYVTWMRSMFTSPNREWGWFVDQHSAVGSTIHGTLLPASAPNRMQAIHRFLPWHRLMVRRFEQSVQQVSADFFIPYWDWTNSSARALPAAVVPLLLVIPLPSGGTHRVTRSPGAPSALPRDTEVSAIEGIRSSYLDFTWALEGRPHNSVHGWVGGTMGSTRTSPADPVFFLHHANVDRIWWRWQQRNGATTTSAPANMRPSLSGSDRIMNPWTDDVDQVLNIRGSTLNFDYV